MAKRISSLSVVLGATAAPFVKAFGAAGNAATSLSSKITGVGATILKFTGIGTAITAVFGALKGIGSGIGLAAELEQTGVAFETMLGSQQTAKALMADLTTFSAATPFEFPEIANSAKKLLAFGVGADDMTKKLTMLGDISAGIGAPLEDIAAIYGKIKSRGQLTGETLNQMAERGIPIYRALAKEMNVSESAVAGLVTAGKIGFPQVDAALAALSGTGGQFSGMMAKQSQTLSGLWSTLTDNISLTMAGLVTTIVEAFGLRGALSALTGFIGNAGGMLNSAVARFAPVVVAMAGGIWNAIVGVWDNIWATVGPIVGTITSWIASNWQAIVANVVSRAAAMWSVVSGAFQGIWTLVTMVGGAVASAWEWAMSAIGFSSDQASSASGKSFESLGGWLLWLGDIANTAFVTIGFALANWQTIAELALVTAALRVVTFGNQIEYIFGTVAPALLTWFGDNWRDIFTTMFNFTTSVFTNLGKNVGNFFAALWGAIKGDGFNFEWTGLTEGFKSTIKEMPKIAERELGGVEKALMDQQSGLENTLGKGLADALAKNKSVGDDAAKALTDAMNKKPPEIKPEIKPPAPFEVDTTQAEKALTKTASVAKETKSEMASVGAVISGSAADLAARAMAENAQAALDARPRASYGGMLSPLPQQAIAAVQDGGKNAARADGNGTSIDGQILALLREWYRKFDRADEDGIDLQEA